MSLRMINTLSAINYQRLSAAFCVLYVAMFVFTTFSPHTVTIHTPATSLKHLSSSSSPTLLVLESSLQSQNVTYCLHVVHDCVKLQPNQKFILHMTEKYI